VRIRFHRAETRRGKYWYANRDPQSPELFQRELDAALEMLAQFPELGQGYLHGSRRMVLPTVPYSIVYFVEATQIHVVAVAHAKQRPGYWSER
jgi:plasmid stabilization system protein ParE